MSAEADAPQAISIVRREALLGKDQRIAAYFFRLRYEVNERVRTASAQVQRLYDDVLLRNLQNLETRGLLEHRLAFISVSVNSLAMPMLEQLHAPGVVYVVHSIAQGADDPASTLGRLSQLRALGYRIGLLGEEACHPEMSPFLAQADFLFVDIGNSDIPGINSQLALAAVRPAALPCVAHNIQSMEEFDVCSRLPFSLYHGQFIATCEKSLSPRMDSSRVKILEILNKLRGDAELAELSALFKQDPTLSFNLLRYMNAIGVGQGHTVSTLEQALFVIGRQKLYRWLTLLLFTSGKTQGLDSALLENALVRARLAELLAQGALSVGECDEVFVAGVFSLLDRVLGMSMEAVLEQVSLPPPVCDVLLAQRGKYAPFLALAIACEQADDARIAELAQAVGLDNARVNSLHADAMLWAQHVNGQS